MKTIAKFILTSALLATSGWADAVDFDTSTWTTGNAAYDAFGTQLTTLFGDDADKFIFEGSYETEADPDTGKNVITLQKVTTKSGGDTSRTSNLNIDGKVGNYEIRLQNGAGTMPDEWNHLFCFEAVTDKVNLTLDNISAPSLCSLMFWGCYGLTSVTFGNSFDTSNVTDMVGMFFSCSGLTSLDLSGFNTSNVTIMAAMFSHCSKLTSLNLSNFNTSNVTSMSDMFSGASALETLIVSPDFPAKEGVNTSYMFYKSDIYQTTMVYSTVKGTEEEKFSAKLRNIVAGYSGNPIEVQLSTDDTYVPVPLVGTLSSGMEIEGNAHVLLPNGYMIETSEGEVSVGKYTKKSGIDVLVDTSGGGAAGGLQGLSTDSSATAVSAAAYGIIQGISAANKATVARWHDGDIDWKTAGSGVAPESSSTKHAFISKGIQIGDNAELLEVIGGGNKLARIYRSLNPDPENDDRISGTAYLTTATPGYRTFGSGELPAGEYVYNSTGGPDTVTPNDTFVINNSEDESGTISANLSTSEVPSGKTAASALKLITGSHTLAITPANTNSINRPLIIGDRGSEVGVVTMGTSGSASSVKALGGITNIDVYEKDSDHSSSLTLAGNDTVTTAGDWTFYGKSTFVANGRIIIGPSYKIELGAEQNSSESDPDAQTELIVTP